jgi:hypothetical protein
MDFFLLFGAFLFGFGLATYITAVIVSPRDDSAPIADAPTDVPSDQIEILPKCGCITCVDARPIGWLPPTSRTRMIVCEFCGNKRCPHATYHGNECTGSNEPGQAGSVFGNCRPLSDQFPIIHNATDLGKGMP